MQYLAVFEHDKEADSYGAYVPDLPGCVAVGETMETVRKLIEKAIQYHLKALHESGAVIPLPSSTAGFIDVAAESVAI